MANSQASRTGGSIGPLVLPKDQNRPVYEIGKLSRIRITARNSFPLVTQIAQFPSIKICPHPENLCKMALFIPHGEDVRYGLWIALALLIFWRLGVVTYRVFFHPLKSFPGPPLAAASTLYRAYFQVFMDGGHIDQFTKLHVKYGMCNLIISGQNSSKSLFFQQAQ